MMQGCATAIMMLAAVYAITRSRSHPRHKGPASMRPFSFQNAPNTSCAVPSVSQTIGRRLNAISPVYSAQIETHRNEPVAVAAMPSGIPIPALQREARVRRGCRCWCRCMQIADSHTFENPRREFRTPKCWHAARACQAARASAAVALPCGARLCVRALNGLWPKTTPWISTSICVQGRSARAPLRTPAAKLIARMRLKFQA